MVGFWILFVCQFKGSLALEDTSTKFDEPSQRLFHQTISDIWKRLYWFIHSFIHSQTFIEKQPGAGTAKIRGEMRDTLITNKLYLVRSYLQIYIYIKREIKSEHYVESHRYIAVVGIRRGWDDFQMTRWDNFVKGVELY